MFGTIGGPELLLILVIALIVFGPRKLPEIGKSMGKMLMEFRKASTDFRRTIEDEVDAEQQGRKAEKMRAAAELTSGVPTPGLPAAPPDGTVSHGAADATPPAESGTAPEPASAPDTAPAAEPPAGSSPGSVEPQ